MKKGFNTYLIFFCFLLLSNASIAQSRTADSLKKLIANDRLDTNKVNHLNALAVELWGNLDTAIICSTYALNLSKKIDVEGGVFGWQKGIARSSYLLGVFNFDKGNFIDALSYNMNAFKIWEELESKSAEPERTQYKIFKSKSLGEIGNAYFGQGNYPQALEFHIRSLKLYEELNIEKSVGSTLGNIGNVYCEQKNYSKALEYYLKSLKVSQKFGNKYDISIDLRNIGNVYRYLNDNTKSLQYLKMALAASKEIGNDLETANNLSSIGALIQNQGDSALAEGKPFQQLYATSMEYYMQSLKMDDEQGNLYGSSMNLYNMGGVYAKQKKYKEAETFFLKALAIDSSIGALNLIKDLHLGLSEIYSVTGNYKKSLNHYQMYSYAKDSLYSDEKDKEITRHELNYEFDKKEAALKAEQDKKEALAEVDKKRQNIFFWLIVSVAMAIAVIAIVVIRSLRIARKQKQIIETQKEVVEEKQREILDSIRYAKRIQQSLMPTSKYIEKNINRLKDKNSL